MPQDDELSRFTRGDQVSANFLHDNLLAIARQTDDPAVRRLVGEVLEGRTSVREMVRQPAFEAELNRGMERFAESWQEMTPEERADLIRQGHAEVSRQREAMGLPPEPELHLDPDNPALRDYDA